MEIRNNASGDVRPNDDAKGAKGTGRGRKIDAHAKPPIASPGSTHKSAPQGDRIELSRDAQYLAPGRVDPHESVDEAREKRQKFIQNVRELLKEGRLNTQERVDRAARKILGD